LCFGFWQYKNIFWYVHCNDATGHQHFGSYKDCVMALITTTKGDMDESLLVKQEGTVDNENELTTWVEYWLEGELVHRSAHVTLKKMPPIGGEAASIA
jgi:hypothetical protein